MNIKNIQKFCKEPFSAFTNCVCVSPHNSTYKAYFNVDDIEKLKDGKFHTYFFTTDGKDFYAGSTNDLYRRAKEHCNKRKKNILIHCVGTFEQCNEAKTLENLLIHFSDIYSVKPLNKIKNIF